MNKKKGIVSMATVGVMLFLGLALSITISLVKKNQENRIEASYRICVGNSPFDINSHDCDGCSKNTLSYIKCNKEDNPQDKTSQCLWGGIEQGYIWAWAFNDCYSKDSITPVPKIGESCKNHKLSFYCFEDGLKSLFCDDSLIWKESNFGCIVDTNPKFWYVQVSTNKCIVTTKYKTLNTCSNLSSGKTCYKTEIECKEHINSSFVDTTSIGKKVSYCDRNNSICKLSNQYYTSESHWYSKNINIVFWNDDNSQSMCKKNCGISTGSVVSTKKIGVWDGTMCRESSNSYIDVSDCEKNKSGGDKDVVCYDNVVQCQKTNAGKTCVDRNQSGTCVIAETNKGDFSSCTTTDGQDGYLMKKNICGGTFNKLTSTRCCLPAKKIAIWDGSVCTLSKKKYIDSSHCWKDLKENKSNNIVCYNSIKECQNAHLKWKIDDNSCNLNTGKYTCSSGTDGNYIFVSQEVCINSNGCDVFVCDDGESECSSTFKVKTCNNNQWTTTACDPGQSCVDGRCQEIFVCDDGESECSSTFKVKTCNNNQWTTTACDLGQSCVDGRCQEIFVCDDGESQCSSTFKVKTCNNNQWTTTACDPGQSCVDGRCQENFICEFKNKECISVSQSRICNSDQWTTTACDPGQSCVDGRCEEKLSSTATIDIKIAFAGVKNGNNQCAINWPVSFRIVDLDGEKVDEFSGIATSSNTTNDKGEIIYNVTGAVKNIPQDGINNSSFFITGPKHLSIKHEKDASNYWLSSFVGDLSLKPGINNYDFSKYSLFAGDVTGDVSGVPDGKIDGRDFSFVKDKVDNSNKAVDGINVIGDIDGNCQVNSNDVDLLKQSLIEINSQLY